MFMIILIAGNIIMAIRNMKIKARGGYFHSLLGWCLAMLYLIEKIGILK